MSTKSGQLQFASATSYAAGKVVQASDWRQIFNVTTPGFGARLGALITTPSRVGMLSNADITGTYAGAHDTTRGFHYTCVLTTASARGWGSGGTFRAASQMRLGRFWQFFKMTSVSTTRVGLGLATSMANLAAASSTSAGMRLVIDAGTIQGRCADGTTESATASFAYALANDTWYLAEIYYNGGASVTFTLRDGTTLAELESATHASNLPSGGTNTAWGMSAIATTGTPTLSDGGTLFSLV